MFIIRPDFKLLWSSLKIEFVNFSDNFQGKNRVHDDIGHGAALHATGAKSLDHLQHKINMNQLL